MSDALAEKPTFAIVVTIVWGVLLLPGLFFVMMVPFMFDAPGSDSNPKVIAAALTVLSFPVLCVVAIVGNWIVWMVRRRHSVVLGSLPAIPIVLLLVGLMLNLAGIRGFE